MAPGVSDEAAKMSFCRTTNEGGEEEEEEDADADDLTRAAAKM